MDDDLHTLEGRNFNQTALAAGMAMGEVRQVGNTPFVLVPGGTKVEDLERLLYRPTRKRAKVTALTAAGFIAYFNRHSAAQADGESTVYADTIGHRFVGILDDDSAASASWRTHVVTYDCPLSPEWVAWSRQDKQAVTQEQFAQFIERHLPDIINPAAADMLEISRTLEAKKSVEFSSGIRLANGENELKFNETIDGSASKGNLRVPDEFAIGIPVFQGGDTYKIVCKLRYRIPTSQGKGLAMWFEMVRPEKVIEDAFKTLATTIAEGTKVEQIEAEPPTV